MNQKIILEKPSSRQIDEREIYVSNLTNQFIKSIGKSDIDINSKELWSEFNEWLNERKKIAKEYKTILDFLELDYNTNKTAEIGKGVFDTIVSNNNLTTIITPYTYYFDPQKRKNIIKGNLKIVSEKYPRKDISMERKIDDINCFITQNPYTKKDIEIFNQLYSFYKYNIIIGIYGKNDDKDKEIKIIKLKELKEKITKNIKEEYIKIINNYFYILASTYQKYKKIKRY